MFEHRKEVKGTGAIAKLSAPTAGTTNSPDRHTAPGTLLPPLVTFRAYKSNQVIHAQVQFSAHRIQKCHPRYT